VAGDHLQLIGQSFAINLTMMLVNRADVLTVDNARKGFKAAFIPLLERNMTPSTWTITAVAGAAQSLAAGDLRFSSESTAPT